jgi:hypothetical protein
MDPLLYLLISFVLLRIHSHFSTSHSKKEVCKIDGVTLRENRNTPGDVKKQVKIKQTRRNLDITKLVYKLLSLGCINLVIFLSMLFLKLCSEYYNLTI